jgi:hypothetical protein
VPSIAEKVTPPYLKRFLWPKPNHYITRGQLIKVMMLSAHQKIIPYAIVFLGIIFGLIWRNLIFALLLAALVGYLIHVIATGYYFYRATSIMMLVFLALIIIGLSSNFTRALLLLVMIVDIVL